MYVIIVKSNINRTHVDTRLSFGCDNFRYIMTFIVSNCALWFTTIDFESKGILT